MECFNIFKVLLWLSLSQQYLKLEVWIVNSWPQSGFGFFPLWLQCRDYFKYVIQFIHILGNPCGFSDHVVAISLENYTSFCELSKICKELLENKKHMYDFTVWQSNALKDMLRHGIQGMTHFHRQLLHTHIFSSIDPSAYKQEIFPSCSFFS